MKDTCSLSDYVSFLNALVDKDGRMNEQFWANTSALEQKSYDSEQTQVPWSKNRTILSKHKRPGAKIVRFWANTSALEQESYDSEQTQALWSKNRAVLSKHKRFGATID